jgi:hypothetical protein
VGAIAEIMEANERSRTWKERHAKGVEMVKRSHNDVIKWYDLDYKNGLWTDGDHQFNDNGTPIIEVISIKNDVWRVAATFCNFRYKQSWLDKQELTKINDGLEKFYNSGEWTGKKGGERQPEQEEPEPPKYRVSGPFTGMFEKGGPDAS